MDAPRKVWALVSASLSKTRRCPPPQDRRPPFRHFLTVSYHDPCYSLVSRFLTRLVVAAGRVECQKNLRVLALLLMAKKHGAEMKFSSKGPFFLDCLHLNAGSFVSFRPPPDSRN